MVNNQLFKVLVDKIKKSASELVEFFRSESPYRQANKGWLAQNIYLNFRSDKRNSSKGFDQIAEVSFFSQPIMQIALSLFCVISLAMFLVFSPLYLMN